MNCDSYTVTTRPFRVKDRQAFEDEMKRLGIWLVHGSYDASVCTDGHEEYRLDGCDMEFSLYDGTRDEEINLLSIIQKHLAEDSVLVIHQVAHEGLRGVSGGVTVVTSHCIKTVTLADVEQQLLHAGPLTDEAVRQLAESVVDNMGGVLYDPTEFKDPWDQEGPEGIEGATDRLIERVTQDVEDDLREALRFYRESSHVVVHVIPFDDEAGVLVNGEVVYVAPSDSQYAMPASQVATALANALGVGVISMDLRLEMKALIEADRYEKATWNNVPSMVAEKVSIPTGGD